MAINYFETYDKGHIHFGGTINLSDFNTEHKGRDNLRGSPIAKRIVGDRRWDQSLLVYPKFKRRKWF